MLYNERSRRVGRKASKNRLNRSDATRGRADGQDLVGGLDHMTPFDGSRSDARIDPGRSHLRGGNDFFCQVVYRLRDAIGRSRFGNHLHGPGGEGLNGRLAALRRQGTQHNNGHGLSFHEFAQKGDAVHFGHFHIERQDVGLQAENFVAGDVGIGRRSHHLDAGLLAEFLRQHLADHG